MQYFLSCIWLFASTTIYQMYLPALELCFSNKLGTQDKYLQWHINTYIEVMGIDAKAKMRAWNMVTEKLTNSSRRQEEKFASLLECSL